MTTLTIPAGVAAITSEWLSEALRPTIGPGARVASFDSTRIGEGVGFLGELARVGLRYDGQPAAGSPASVVVKLPTLDLAPRGMARLFQFYDREIGFYRDLGEKVGVRVPKCYHVTATPEDGDFALVLEDVNAAPGDQLASCSIEQAKAALRVLARLHAKWWESPEMDRYDWLPKPGNPVFDVMRGAYLQALPVFLEHWAERFDPAVVRICERFGSSWDAIFEMWFGRPLTLAHQDFRLDNMLFGEPGTPEEMVLIDWQLCQKSLPALDLQYFIAGNFPSDVGEAHTEDFLRLYHEELRAGGVRDYSLAELREDFAGASLVFGVMIPIGITAIDPANYAGRGAQVIDVLYRSLSDSMLRHEAERFIPA